MGRLAAGGRSVLRALLPAEHNLRSLRRGARARRDGGVARARRRPRHAVAHAPAQARLGSGAVRGGVAGLRLVHGRADSPHHLRADDGVAAAHRRRRRGLSRRAAGALAGAGGDGDGHGAGVRRAAAGAVRRHRRRRLRRAAALGHRSRDAAARRRVARRCGGRRRAPRGGADRADGGASAVFAALARRRLPIRVVVRVAERAATSAS